MLGSVVEQLIIIIFINILCIRFIHNRIHSVVVAMIIWKRIVNIYLEKKLMMENTCMNQLQFTRNPQKRSIVMKTEMKVTLTRYILIYPNVRLKMHASSIHLWRKSIYWKYPLKYWPILFANYFSYCVNKYDMIFRIFIKKGKKGSLEALQSVDSTEYINERNILLTSFLSGVSGRAISKTLFFLENDLTTYYMLYKSSESTINLRNAWILNPIKHTFFL